MSILIFGASLLSPLGLNANVFATTNSGSQEINQAQLSRQISACLSGGDTVSSCVNKSLQVQFNFGNNALGQQGGSGSGSGGGNQASQGINQGQSSRQNSLCVSGGSTTNSCNNTSTQLQANFGNNALGQQGGSG